MTATTPTYGFPYRLAKDSPDIAGATKDLALAVESAMALQLVASLPAAGAFNGQMLVLTVDWRTYRWDSSATAWKPLNPNMPACVLTDSVDRSYAASTASWIGLASVDEQSTISGSTMAVAGTGGTAIANAPSITIREAGLYTVGLRATWATDGSNGTPVKVIGVTLNSTSAVITRATCLASANAPTQGSTVQSEGQGTTAMVEVRLAANDVLRPVCVASGAAWINSGSTSIAQGGKARFWAHKIRD